MHGGYYKSCKENIENCLELQRGQEIWGKNRIKIIVKRGKVGVFLNTKNHDSRDKKEIIDINEVSI